MLALFEDLKPKVKTLTVKIRFDSVVNRLHYKVTAGFLLVCCALVTATQYIGSPIQCILSGSHGDDAQFGKSVNTYCWISSTYTLLEHYDKEVGTAVIQPGVGPANPDTSQKKYHAYYQWVPFVLVFQAILFYFPHYIWRNLESNTLQNIIGELCSNDFEESDVKKEKLKKVVKYLANSRNRHTGMFLLFLLCEILNFVVVVGNIAFTDVFLGGEFREYGSEVISFMGQDDSTRTDPLTRVFPRVTKCDWHFFGPSGTIQRYDALCVLAINIINEKIYVFLWFWFIILAAITGMWLMVRAISVVVAPFRRKRLENLVGSAITRGGVSGEKRRSRLDNASHSARVLADDLSVADWFIVSQIGHHMDPLYFPEFVVLLAEEIKGAAKWKNELKLPSLLAFRTR